jgi:hypothetical protein
VVELEAELEVELEVGLGADGSGVAKLEAGSATPQKPMSNRHVQLQSRTIAAPYNGSFGATSHRNGQT